MDEAPTGKAERESFLASIDLTELRDGVWTGPNTDHGHGVLFGGQLLAQSIVAATRATDGKGVRSIHTVFARGGRIDEQVELHVDPLHEGRSFGSVSVSVRQGDRLCCRSLVLLDVPDADLIRHGVPMPDAEDPPAQDPATFWQFEITGGASLYDKGSNPGEIAVWSTFPDTPDDPLTSQAMLAFASDGFLIGTAMMPHEGFDQSQAHVTVATTVLDHTISFHEPFSAADWFLMSQESTYAGRGRAYGRATVHSADGRHVASFTQDSLVRAMPTDGRPG